MLQRSHAERSKAGKMFSSTRWKSWPSFDHKKLGKFVGNKMENPEIFETKLKRLKHPKGADMSQNVFCSICSGNCNVFRLDEGCVQGNFDTKANLVTCGFFVGKPRNCGLSRIQRSSHTSNSVTLKKL